MNRTGDVRIDEMMPRLKKSWPVVPFEECLEPLKVQYRKLKSGDIHSFGKIPVIDQGESFISGYTDDRANEYPGKLPVIVFGDHTRRFKFVDFKFAIGADGTQLLYPFDALEPKFFYYYLCSLNLEAQGYSRHYKFLKKASVPIPLLTEQHSIVIKLAKLLDKTDICQKRLAKIPSMLKRFQQSIITAACSGQLTADWRDARDSGQDWERCRFNSICDFIGGSQPPKKNFVYESKNGYVRFIQIRDYKSDNYLTFIPKEMAKRFCSKEDIMIGRYGPPLFQILRGIEGAYNVALMKAVPKSRGTLLNDFLYIRLQEPTLRNYIISASERTVGQDGVRKDLLEDYEIELPPYAEQQEIVRRVTSLFKLADKIEARYTNAQLQVDKLTQSILAKAFRGELVP